MSSSSWCNWSKCLSCSSSLCLMVSRFVCLILTRTPQHRVSSCTFSRPYWAASCERWVTVQGSSCMHHKFFYAIISASSAVCMCIQKIFQGWNTGCLFAVLHTEGKKCSGFTALHAACLTSGPMAPALFLLSLCQCEGCYGCSAARNLFSLSMISSIYHHKAHAQA